MEKKYRNTEKSCEHNSFQKIFLLSNYLEEPKVQKDWFTGKFEKYMNIIKHDVDNIMKEARYDRFRKKINSNSYSQNKNFIFSDNKKFNHFLPIIKGNKFYLKKLANKYQNLSRNNDEITKNDSSINLDSHYEYENKTLNTNINKSVDRNINNDIITKNEFNFNLELDNLPNISRIGNKKKYITKYINNISEKTDSLEKKLIRQERMRYMGFKSKYNRLFNEYKKVQVDIDQYINPQKDKRYKFDLNNTGDEINDKKYGGLKKIMRQISMKLKNNQENKPSIPDIINELEIFRFREKRLRDRIKKSHDKFDYLINDSNIIQKRINNKCQKNT